MKPKQETVVLQAIIADGAQTKTALDGNMGDEYRPVLWQPQDSVGICSFDWWYSSLNKFVNTEPYETATASLVGEIDEGYSMYYAFYPYSRDLFFYDYRYIRFNQPSMQTYREESFSANAMPMVSRAGRGKTMEFYSLCGVLAVNLTGTKTVKSVSFTGYDASGNPIPVAGQFTVDMEYDEYPTMTATQDEGGAPISSVSLNCKEGVQLDAAEPTSFYIVLPVGTYHSFTITVATEDKKLMLKKGTNPLEIKRANVTKAKSLVFVEEVAFDLSEHGTANSYIVSEPGLYSFDATVIGNGGYGIIEGANFHTNDPFISPVSAELVWVDKPGAISNVTFDGNNVNFVANGSEGNALVAVRDASGNILWSWHIWATDEPQEQTYINDLGEFVLLDRNLGATRADRGSGDEYKESVGLFYQWGRKDPYTRNKYTIATRQISVMESIMNPTVVASENNPWSTEWNRNFWSTDQKTVYDPCPVGYKVPVRDVWAGFTTTGENTHNLSEINVSGSYDRGWNFIYDGTNITWYPATGELDHYGSYVEWSDRGRLWAAKATTEGVAYLDFYYSSTWDAFFYFREQWHQSYFGNAVRCMKDEGHVDAAMPLVTVKGFSEMTSESVVVNAVVTDEGAASVTERGIVWGVTKDINLDNAAHIAKGEGRGEFSVNLTGLQPATKYYVKAYAINERGISYSKEKAFYTSLEGNVINLSQEGTANCYIVPPIYAEYAFNASVKGNSNESVGEIASAEVLWETSLKYDNLQMNEIISEVYVKGDNIHFLLPTEAREGNALIAVKDADDNILWSWHIWVVDFDPEETQQTYKSGAIMMDRNLGATSVIPIWNGAETTDYTTYGLYYQWGRKDPFPYIGSIVPSGVIKTYDHSNSVEYSVQNPTVVSVGWNNRESTWSTDKTMYDPCPSGWRVPDPSAWSGWINEMVNAGYQESHKSVMSPFSTPMAYYPNTDRVEGYSTSQSAYNDNIFMWTTDPKQELYSHRSSDTFEFTDWSDDVRMVIRCMKEQKMDSGDNEGYTGSEYEW